ncbi:MAG: helix-turn-helix domain containing protein, partial [Gammaproteobacteria bacterium]|nr:helix-turn-helix domain containing protein [Gammaproteobacteria bacterium]
VHMELLDMLRREVKRSSSSRYEHRLHALLLMVSGFTATQVAACFGEDPRTVRRWIIAFENHGLSALKDPSRPGRPPSLDAQQQAALRHDLNAPPTAVGLSGDTWNGRLLASHLAESFDTTLGVRQCQRLLRRIRASPEP